MKWIPQDTVRNLISRPFAQPLLLRMLKLCHAGMNYGGGQSVYCSGEIGALEFLSENYLLSRPFLLFDVGANNGEYLHLVLRALGNRQLRAFSFEPQSASFEALRVKYGDDPRVELKKIALGSNEGTAEIFFTVNGETTASLVSQSLSDHSKAGQSCSETVLLSTIDQICRENGIEHIDLLKIDTEGYELDVLRGASEMLKRGGISAIQFEFGDTFLHTPYHFIDFWEFLSPQYKMYRILRQGLTEVHRYTPDLDIYKIVNYLCIWKAKANAPEEC
jgi:FkbM family methyltransferase